MKTIKFMVCVVSLLLAGATYASQTKYGVSIHTADKYERAVWKAFWGMSPEEQKIISQFHEWAQQGDAASFYNFIEQTHELQYKNTKECPVGTILTAGVKGGACVRPEVLLKTDNFKNNLLHNAKDQKTLEALSKLFSEFFSKSWVVFNNLKDEKNVAGETPLIKHVSAGDLGSFHYLYEGSSLQETAAKIKELSTNPNPLVQENLETYKQDFFRRGGRNAGSETLVSLIKRAKDGYLKENILSYCQKEMAFLF